MPHRKILKSSTPELGIINYIDHRPVAEGRPGGAVPPQQEIKLKSCPTKPKFALSDCNHFTKATNDLVYLKMVMPS